MFYQVQGCINMIDFVHMMISDLRYIDDKGRILLKMGNGILKKTRTENLEMNR